MSREEIEELYDELLALDDRFERKGKTMPYTSHNGHMFSFITKEGTFVAIRLGKEDQEAFMKKFGTGPVIQYGATMRGYVEVTEELLKDPKKVLPYLKKSYDYVSSLPPK